MREGVGGTPLLLLHGYPETKRIWWRNIAPLAAAGFEVIVPDLRGYGDSDLSPTTCTTSRCTRATCTRSCTTCSATNGASVAGGDIGGVVGVDLVHRFDDFVERFCFFNTVPPAAIEEYAAAGLDYGSLSALSDGPTGDYRELQGARPDELAAMLPHRRGAAAVDRGHVPEPAVGVAGHVRPRRRRLHDRAVRRRGAAARRVVGVPARARPADDRAAAARRAPSTCRRCCSTAPTTTWSATTS